MNVTTTTTATTTDLHWSRFVNPWLSMTLAIIFELIGTINTKASRGITLVGPSVTMFVSYLFCAMALAFAMDNANETLSGGHRGLDLGVAYATWSGSGTIAAALAGIYLFGERLSIVQWVGIVLTIVGVTLVNTSSDGTQNNQHGGRQLLLRSQYGSIE